MSPMTIFTWDLIYQVLQLLVENVLLFILMVIGRPRPTAATTAAIAAMPQQIAVMPLIKSRTLRPLGHHAFSIDPITLFI